MIATARASRQSAGQRLKVPEIYFRFVDDFLPAGLFAEGFFLAADLAVADFVRVRGAGFRFGLGFAWDALPA